MGTFDTQSSKKIDEYWVQKYSLKHVSGIIVLRL
jgi:hypothetical protein